MASYAGKLLRIDLSNRRIETQSTSDYSGMYLGGRGMATRIYWDECRPDSSAYDSDVPLIMETSAEHLVRSSSSPDTTASSYPVSPSHQWPCM